MMMSRGMGVGLESRRGDDRPKSNSSLARMTLANVGRCWQVMAYFMPRDKARDE